MEALKVRHKMTSHFAAISPKVDINALVMDLTVKAAGVTCCLSAINIAGYVQYVHVVISMRLLSWGGEYFCANSQ